MMTTQPTSDDPQDALHRSNLQGLGIIGEALAGRAPVQPDTIPHHRNSPWQEGAAHRTSPLGQGHS
jgi:hypothetical protein